MRISREFRFFLRPQQMADDCANAWGGWNAGSEIAPWLQLRLEVSGSIDPVTGYLCNIRELDNLLRDSVAEWSARHPSFAGFRYHRFLRQIHQRIRQVPDRSYQFGELSLVVNPCLSLAISREAPAMIRWSQQFEFSAAHRLDCSRLSEEENRRLFGKCNNPAGHGHNYVVEVTVAFPDQANATSPFSPPSFESLLKAAVIDRLDHKHLNLDVPEFSQRNPSVENIATVIWEWLNRELPASTPLQNVRVYETPKTWADCDGT